MKKKIAPRIRMVRNFSTRPLHERPIPLCDLLEFIIENLFTRDDVRSVPNSSFSMTIAL